MHHHSAQSQPPRYPGYRRAERTVRFRRWLAGIATVLLILAACSGPSSGTGGATATETTTPMPTPPPATATPTASPTNTPEPPTATATSEPTATAAPTTAPTATATSVPPSPTATQPSLPTGGAELSILGKPAERIIPAGENGEVLYAVTSAGLSRSDDGGVTWVAAGDVQPGTIIASRDNPDLLYAGERAGCGRGFTDVGFRRSEDGGQNWSVIDTSHGYEPLLARGSGDARILFGTDCGLSVSTDGGESWSDVQGLAGESIFDVEVADGQIFVTAATEGGTGRLFQLTSTGPASYTVEGTLTEYWGAGYVDWHDGRIALATAAGVGVSDDGGQSWTWSREGLEETTYSVDPSQEPIPEDELDQGYQLSDIAIDPTNPDRIWVAGSHGAYLSTDGGGTWQRVGGAAEIDSLVISTVAERVYVSSDGSTRVWALDGPGS